MTTPATTLTATTFDGLRAITTDLDAQGTPVYVRWSHGPEADAANGWISQCYCVFDDETGQQLFNADHTPRSRPEVGLSALRVTCPDDAEDLADSILRYAGEVHGETCYILTGDEIGRCDDGDPLLRWVHPVAILTDAVILEARTR